jgi:dTDP-4-dehydrorhamnose 3,5-epimerase
MKIHKTDFNDLKIVQGKSFFDNRGYFREIYKKNIFDKKKIIFWCMSKSKKNVLRGMHLQTKNPQEKYISVVKGKILDVVIDLRSKSKTFKKYFKIILSAKNNKSLFIPKGFAHGFLTLDKENIIFYGNTNYRSQKNEVGLLWNDENLKIKWPTKKPIVSSKDKLNMTLKEFNKKFKL